MKQRKVGESRAKNVAKGVAINLVPKTFSLLKSPGNEVPLCCHQAGRLVPTPYASKIKEGGQILELYF